MGENGIVPGNDELLNGEIFYTLLPVGGCATSTDFAGHAGATADLKLTFYPDHSVGANHTSSWIAPPSVLQAGKRYSR